ncbi:MAG TPA: hypothetical protein VFF91_10595 [Pseudoxanthomonas sp.]|nr:hypothetical protein [Pseudoxanthomonas sp.]
MARSTTFPPWMLPLAIAATMLVSAHLAWALSVQAGHIEACNPYWDGCTSISRAARHGLGNHLFRLLMLPCALLLALHWWLAGEWLRQGDARGADGAWLLAFGIAAAQALAVYVAFLGTDGPAYAFLRRYGVTVYFGCGYLAQLWFLRIARRRGRLRRPMRMAMAGVCLAMLGIGVFKLLADLTLDDPARMDRLENALEWQLGLLLAGWYLLQAWLWRGERVALDFGPR